MNLLQPVLVLLLGLSFLLYRAKFRRELTDRTAGLVLFTSALLAVLFPEMTNRLAHLVGIGRGADLLFYLSFAISLFLFILLFSHVRELRLRQTRIVRELALQSARPAQPEVVEMRAEAEKSTEI